MRNKTGISKTIFIIAVLMLLLRPFIVYQAAAKEARLNPERAWSLLQRLIKKKDDHAEHPVADAVAIEQRSLYHRLTVRLLPVVNLLRAFLTNRKHDEPVYMRGPFVATRRYHYRLTSCLQI